VKRIVISLSVACILAFGCSSSRFTRAKAKDIIEESDNYKLQKRWIAVTRSEANDCIRHGYLTWVDMMTWHLVVTQKGKVFFDGAQGEIVTPGDIVVQQLAVAPSVPIKPHVIEVTGITDGDNGSKIVEYQWNWDFKGQPKEVQDLIFKDNPAIPAKATLKLYDDGWRVIKVD